MPFCAWMTPARSRRSPDPRPWLSHLRQRPGPRSAPWVAVVSLARGPMERLNGPVAGGSSALGHTRTRELLPFCRPAALPVRRSGTGATSWATTKPRPPTSPTSEPEPNTRPGRSMAGNLHAHVVFAAKYRPSVSTPEMLNAREHPMAQVCAGVHGLRGDPGGVQRSPRPRALARGGPLWPPLGGFREHVISQNTVLE
jgi:hypothetical protein